MVVRVRAARVEDGPALGRLNAVGNEHIEREHGMPVHPAGAAEIEGYASAWTDRLLSDEPTLTLVATDSDDDIQGFVSVTETAGAVEVTTLYVQPSRIGGGIGTTLLDAALVAAPALFGPDRSARLHLWSLDGNDRARRFYERRGWHPTGRTKPLPSGDGVLVEFELRSPT